MAISGIGGVYSSHEVAQSCIGRIRNTNADNAEKTDSGSNKKIDFTNTTGKEVLDWVNNSLANGEMTWDDSGAFLLWFNREDRFNLMEEMQGAAAGARDLRFDENVVKRFEWATQYLRDLIEKQLFSIDVQA